MEGFIKEGDYELCRTLANGDFISNLTQYKITHPHYAYELGMYLIEEFEDYHYDDRIISDERAIDILRDIYDEWGLLYLSIINYDAIVELIICNIPDTYYNLNRLESISRQLLSSLNYKLSTELTLEEICDLDNKAAHRTVLDYCSYKAFIYMLTESEEVTEYYDQQYKLK